MSGTFEVDNPELARLMQELGSKLHTFMPPNVGFTLLIFEFGQGGGDLFYISDAKRDDMIRTMRECIVKMEAHHPAERSDGWTFVAATINAIGDISKTEAIEGLARIWPSLDFSGPPRL